METTRHFVATVYVVNDGATALHHHERIDRWLPPGGHIDRDERPIEAARREVREETGHEVTFPEDSLTQIGPDSYELPDPAHLNLHDIHHYDDGTVGHQHIDFLYYGTIPGRTIDPQDGERHDDHWAWFTVDDLQTDADDDTAATGPASSWEEESGWVTFSEGEDATERTNGSNGSGRPDEVAQASKTERAAEPTGTDVEESTDVAGTESGDSATSVAASVACSRCPVHWRASGAA